MSSKQVSFLIVTVVLLLGVWACTLPANTLPTSGGNPAPITPQTLPPPTIAKTMTATSLPILDPDSALTFGGATTAPVSFTSTPTITPAATSSISIPDFEEVLTFSIGGGARYCGTFVGDIRIRVFNGGGAELCLWENISYPLTLEWINPDGNLVASNIFILDDQDEWYWQEYPSFPHYPRGWLEPIFLYWPVTVPTGLWRLNAYAGDVSTFTDFLVTGELDYPVISVIDPYSLVQPANPTFHGFHPLRLNDKNTVKAVGANYPANKPVYILVYLWDSELKLIHKQALFSDLKGSFAIELSGLFEVGQGYLIVGISDPSIELFESVPNFGNVFNEALPHDLFIVVPQNAASSKIDEKYVALGSEGSVLENPSGAE